MDKLSMEGGFFSGFNANHDASMEQRGTLKQQSLRPVTIKQLTELQLPQSDDATLLCDGYPLNSITFVAVLRNMRDMPNCHLLQLEDGTGAINARIWVERLDETTRTRIQQLPLNDYVRVYGTPRSSNGSLQVFLHQVLPINDYNEVTMHLLETINTHLYYTRGAAATTKSTYSSSNTVSMVSDDLSEFTPQQRNIMAALRAHRHEIGMHITEVARATNLSIQTIRTELEQLASEGHIYNTIDNDHFRTVQ